MHVQVRTLPGAIVSVANAESMTVEGVLSRAAEATGMHAAISGEQLSLSYAGRRLPSSSTLTQCGVPSGATLHMAAALPGGKPVTVKLLTPQTATKGCGAEVTIDIEEDTPMYEVKLRLQETTGVPVAAQKVMLAGIGQMVMGDKSRRLAIAAQLSALAMSILRNVADRVQITVDLVRLLDYEYYLYGELLGLGVAVQVALAEHLKVPPASIALDKPWTQQPAVMQEFAARHQQQGSVPGAPALTTSQMAADPVYLAWRKRLTLLNSAWFTEADSSPAVE
ncbi:hypothetical protein QJQ45_016195, partial [Haematococcus lacustris]